MKTKLILAFAVVATALLGMTSVASADSVSLAPGGAITSTSLGRLQFVGGPITPECNVQLRGTLRSGRFAKVDGVLLGQITGATITNCTTFTSAAVLGLPWNLRYAGIEGTLPDGVTGLRLEIENAQFEVTVIGIFRCLSQGDTFGTMTPSSSSGSTYVSGLITSDRTALPTRGSGCPASAFLQGSLGLTPTQTVVRL
jgi:hypothetical protein